MMQPGIKTVSKRGPSIQLTAAKLKVASERHIHPRRKRAPYYYFYAPPDGLMEDWSHKLNGIRTTEGAQI